MDMTYVRLEGWHSSNECQLDGCEGCLDYCGKCDDYIPSIAFAEHITAELRENLASVFAL